MEKIALFLDTTGYTRTLRLL